MRKVVILLLIGTLNLVFVSCEKDEPRSSIYGSWELVEIDAYSNDINEYTGDWSELIMEFDGDTLKYDYEKGINYDEVTSSTYREFLYNLKLEIDNDVLVTCNLTNIETGILSDTSFTATLEEGDFDFSRGGGGDYDFTIRFGENNFYIINFLYASKDEIDNNFLILRTYYSFPHDLNKMDIKYYFRRTSN